MVIGDACPKCWHHQVPCLHLPPSQPYNDPQGSGFLASFLLVGSFFISLEEGAGPSHCHGRSLPLTHIKVASSYLAANSMGSFFFCLKSRVQSFETYKKKNSFSCVKRAHRLMEVDGFISRLVKVFLAGSQEIPHPPPALSSS